MSLKGMNNWEIYDNMSKVSGMNVAKYTVVTKLVVQCNMGTYHPKLMLKSQENLLLWNILILYIKL